MTEEELKKKEEELKVREDAIQKREDGGQLKEILDKVETMQAELKSYKDENDELKASAAKQQAELLDAKALNFKLSRQVSSAKPEQTAEEILYKMFFPEERKKGER